MIEIDEHCTHIFVLARVRSSSWIGKCILVLPNVIVMFVLVAKTGMRLREEVLLYYRSKKDFGYHQNPKRCIINSRQPISRISEREQTLVDIQFPWLKKSTVKVCKIYVVLHFFHITSLLFLEGAKKKVSYKALLCRQRWERVFIRWKYDLLAVELSLSCLVYIWL